MALIQFAINSSMTGKMTLRQIYQWIEEKFPYFRTAKPGLLLKFVTKQRKLYVWKIFPLLHKYVMYKHPFMMYKHP